METLYPETASNSAAEDILDKFYSGARCGLYHAGVISKYVFIDGDVSVACYGRPHEFLSYHQPRRHH